MTTSFPFTIHRLPLTMPYPFTQHLAKKTMRFRLSAGFTVIHDPFLPADQAGLMVNGKCLVNSKWFMVNGAAGGRV